MPVLDFTGERYVPGAPGAIAYEHCHRYAFARRFVSGRRVLDAACGEGYGTALLASVAAEAAGIDIDAPSIDHARSVYGGRPNVRYVVGSVTALPFAAAAFDVVVSFETVEHIAAADQATMLAEFSRVLKADGVLVLSSPNKRRYSDERNYRNPFHIHELYRDDLAQLLDRGFPHRRWFHQQALYASAIWCEGAAIGGGCEAWSGGADAVTPASVADGLYYVVVAAASAAALPPEEPRLSLFSDRADTELTRAQDNAAEVLRLDGLLKDRDAALDRQAAHVVHLEKLVGERERIVTERDGELAEASRVRASLERSLAVGAARRAELEHELADKHAALATAGGTLDDARAALAHCETELAKACGSLTSLQHEHESLEAALAAQERMIAYQQSLRGWVHTPLLWLQRAGRGWLGRRA